MSLIIDMNMSRMQHR